MKYFELKCTIYIKANIEFSRSFEILSKYISTAMVKGGFENTHKNNMFKYYNYGGLLPIEKDGIYKKGSSYSFSIRSLNESLIDALSQSLRENINDNNILVVQTEKKTVKQFFITELYSATPVIVSTENGKFWTMKESGDILQLQKQLHDNLEKKYQSFFKEKLKSPQNFIQLLEIKNRVPQNIQIHKNNKRIRFFGNKFKIIPNEDELSQKLAFTALACGVGEKNSYGGGFCLGRGLK